METLHEDYIAAGIRNQTAQEQQEFNLFAQLKPALVLDQNQWVVTYGDDSQGGLIVGFGNSPHLAIMDFNAQWYKNIADDTTPEIFPGTNDALDDLKI